MLNYKLIMKLKMHNISKYLLPNKSTNIYKYNFI